MGGSRIEDVITTLNPDELARAASRLEKIKANRVPFSDIVLEEGYQSAAILNEMFSTRNRLDVIRDPGWLLQPSDGPS